jgi:multiple sugar transport system ATP-binding protein
VRQPAAFLMDEPLSNLDAKLRVQMRADIKRIQADLGTTMIYVTHDQVEAMTMGHQVAVMRKGELQQVAPPQELYDSPVNVFVGGFIGSPSMNMLLARIERADEGLAVAVGETRMAIDNETRSLHPALEAYEGREIVLGIRPEDLDDAALANGDLRPRLQGKVEMREALGSEVLVHFTIAAPQAVTDDVRELVEDVGDDRAVDQLAAGVVPDEATLVGRFSPRTRVLEGDAVDVVVDQRALHFFDLETGRAIRDGAVAPA